MYTEGRVAHTGIGILYMYYACIIHVNSGEFIYMYVHVNEILNQLKSITVALMKSSLREWFNNTNAISYRKKNNFGKFKYIK